MKPKIYIETSIISYLTARPSRDVLVNANQMLAKEWWTGYLDNFETFVSEVVITEIEKGDPEFAKLRLTAVKGIRALPLTNEAKSLAEEILARNILPAKATVDVLHISIASVNSMDFLLSLNCKHIANAFIYRRIRDVCRDLGYEPPIICTLQEILEKEKKIDD